MSLVGWRRGRREGRSEGVKEDPGGTEGFFFFEER